MSPGVAECPDSLTGTPQSRVKTHTNRRRDSQGHMPLPPSLCHPRFSITCGETVSATRRRDHFVAGFFRFIVGHLRGESRSKGLDANGLFEPLDDVG